MQRAEQREDIKGQRAEQSRKQSRKLSRKQKAESRELILESRK